ncbi:6717_t:CDS:2, partial [Gigaspora margarita]
NESEEGDYSPKRSETTHLIVQELPKPPTPHKKENNFVNLALMEIDPNKASGESNMEINPMQEDEIIVLANNYNIEGKRIVTGSNAIKIINKRSFSSSGDNRDINLQKVILGRTKCESLKEQDKETSRIRSKAIKMSKENPYMNNGLANNMFKEKESDKFTIILLTGAPVVYGSVDEPVGSSSRVPGVNMNKKGLLQKELTLKIGCHNINRLKTNQQKFETLAFDIFAVTETNLNRKEGFFVRKKVENFKFFWSDTLIDKKKGLGVVLGIKHA